MLWTGTMNLWLLHEPETGMGRNYSSLLFCFCIWTWDKLVIWEYSILKCFCFSSSGHLERGLFIMYLKEVCFTEFSDYLLYLNSFYFPLHWLYCIQQPLNKVWGVVLYWFGIGLDTSEPFPLLSVWASFASILVYMCLYIFLLVIYCSFLQF